MVQNFPNKINWKSIEPTGLNLFFNSAPYEHRGLAQIHERSYDARVLLEIRDVRVPASSHHPSFTRLAKHRTHLIAYTHADLIDEATRDGVLKWTTNCWPHAQQIFFVDTRIDSRKSGDTNSSSAYMELYNGILKHLTSSNQALTVGVANVGKSSILQSILRYARDTNEIPNRVKVNCMPYKTKKGKGEKRLIKGSMPGIQDTPGKTREITEYLLRDSPKAYFMDVPGITPPTAFFDERPDAWFGYGATNLLPLSKDAAENVQLQVAFCAYVLSCANRDGIFNYVDRMNLEEPTNDINKVLSQLANSNKYDTWDEEKKWLKRCQTFLKFFNTGNLGPVVLDDMSDMSWKPFVFRDHHFEAMREKNNAKYQQRDRKNEYDDNEKTSWHGGGGCGYGNEHRKNNPPPLRRNNKNRPGPKDSISYKNKRVQKMEEGNSTSDGVSDWLKDDDWFKNP